MAGGKQKGKIVTVGPIEILVGVIFFIALMYWVFVPIWGFMGEAVKVLGGR